MALNKDGGGARKLKFLLPHAQTPKSPDIPKPTGSPTTNPPKLR